MTRNKLRPGKQQPCARYIPEIWRFYTAPNESKPAGKLENRVPLLLIRNDGGAARRAAAQTALLVIDIQACYPPEIPDEIAKWHRWAPFRARMHEVFVPNTQKLLKAFRACGMDVCYLFWAIQTLAYGLSIAKSRLTTAHIYRPFLAHKNWLGWTFGCVETKPKRVSYCPMRPQRQRR